MLFKNILVKGAGSTVLFTSLQIIMYDTFLKIKVRIYIYGITLNFKYLYNNFYLCGIHQNIKFCKVPHCKSNA
jgi:hypothetical protein